MCNLAHPTRWNLRRLVPCRLCRVRMAVPLRACCRACDVVTLPAMVPDDLPARV